LQRRKEDVEAAITKAAAFRKELAVKRNEQNFFRLRRMQLKPGDLVLKFDYTQMRDLTTKAKMRPRWLGPYRISKQSPVSRAYRLETLDGIVFDRPTHGDYLKKFVE
ncbi:hypothetical protein BKA56DRAFT_439860, partial [Ilyonectria sp. MPI-CAGE-AT-0026]